jgi:hypothetical protein
MHSCFGSFSLLLELSVRVIIFSSVSKLVFFFKSKPNRNRFKRTGSSSVWFGYFKTKTGLARFFPVWLGSIFSVSGLENQNRTELVSF